MRSYFFDDVDQLISHLQNILKNTGPIRLQKTLYFLYAFYGATYGSMSSEENISELDNQYPSTLFPVEFQAWEYGPVIRDVYFKNKNGEYDEMEDFTIVNFQSKEDRDVIDFLDSLTRQLNEMSDFALVDRSHVDKAWSNKFDPTDKYSSNVIDNDELINEYRERLQAAGS
ncbi:Panacea domain-containing protein [Enterococcus casseliflavus]|uniref:Panacea domain-containing protein n=1 Tax=Enterococcus casseliflavus TaxID=37734 RepID=UPI0012E2B6AD|nr:type II toxin-antitoxin system antitoxin SocA domain-containing protein [Enterococcus casseliflavus]MUN75567.1 DUF4065 domain-containing protein [Enterococcus casseliflavus]MUN97938.1 DUF4065 domain-containing protein [Enterococcus casseliflavus]